LPLHNMGIPLKMPQTLRPLKIQVFFKLIPWWLEKLMR